MAQLGDQPTLACQSKLRASQIPLSGPFEETQISVRSLEDVAWSLETRTRKFACVDRCSTVPTYLKGKSRVAFDVWLPTISADVSMIASRSYLQRPARLCVLQAKSLHGLLMRETHQSSKSSNRAKSSSCCRTEESQSRSSANSEPADEQRQQRIDSKTDFPTQPIC